MSAASPEGTGVERSAPPRTTAERVRDTLVRMRQDVDAWVATVGVPGEAPALVPLSFDWDGADLLLVTSPASPAGRNLRRHGRARLALGELRDVVMIDAAGHELAVAALPAGRLAGFVRRTGWDPSGDDVAAYLLVPQRIQAWRESNELAGRTIMRDGRWACPPAG